MGVNDFRGRLRGGAALLAALVLCTRTAQAGLPVKPLIETKDGTAVRTGDAAILSERAAKPGKSAWLIRLSKAWYLRPPARSCEVYLQPEVCHERLRRGEFRRGIGFDESHGKTRWELNDRAVAYAVVPPPTERFARGRLRPGTLDGPFTVAGTISDEDLVQAVDLVRMKDPEAGRPKPAASRVETGADGNVREVIGVIRTSGFSIDRTLPISALTAKDANHLQISTSTGHGSGQQIDLERKEGRWTIVQVWQWNA